MIKLKNKVVPLRHLQSLRWLRKQTEINLQKVPYEHVDALTYHQQEVQRHEQTGAIEKNISRDAEYLPPLANASSFSWWASTIAPLIRRLYAVELTVDGDCTYRGQAAQLVYNICHTYELLQFKAPFEVQYNFLPVARIACTIDLDLVHDLWNALLRWSNQRGAEFIGCKICGDLRYRNLEDHSFEDYLSNGIGQEPCPCCALVANCLEHSFASPTKSSRDLLRVFIEPQSDSGYHVQSFDLHVRDLQATSYSEAVVQIRAVRGTSRRLLNRPHRLT